MKHPSGYHRNHTWKLCPCGTYFRQVRIESALCEPCRKKLARRKRRLALGLPLLKGTIPKHLRPLLFA